MENEIVKILFLFIYIFIFVSLIKKEKTTVLYSLIIFLNLSVLFSLLLIEYGMYILEQQITGYENGAFYIYYLYSLLSLILFYKLSLKNKIVFTTANSPSYNIFFPVSVVFASVLLFSYFNNPFYNRFDVFDGPYKLLFVRIEYLFNFVFLFSLFLARNFNKKLVIYFVYSLLMFLRGSQFGAYMIASIWLFISYYLQNNKLKLNLKLALFFVLISIVPFIIKISQTDIIFFYDRIVLEGHVFWGTINLVNQNGPNPDFSAFISNYNDLMSGFQQFNSQYGFGKLMYEISPGYTDLYEEKNVRFAAGYPAILIYHFGFGLSMLFNLLFTYIYFLIVRYMIYCFINKDIFISFIVYFMIYNTFSDFFVQGEYANFRIKFLIKLIITLVVIIIYRLNKLNKLSSKVKLQYA